MLSSQFMRIVLGILVPFVGTTAGAACVFFMKGAMNERLQKFLLGFASGVMVAASIWSLIVPAIEASSSMGRLSFIPAAIGTAVGIAFLLVLDEIIPHLHIGSDCPEGSGGKCSKMRRTTMLCLAVTLHNIPEGLATGVVFAGVLAGEPGITMAGALALSIGIAIQNFPEGAVISMPLAGEGEGRKKAFVLGMLSGTVEPVAALVTVFMAGFITPLLPYFLSFAAGAMLYVVVEELIPEASSNEHSNVGPIGFGLGFILMMILDVALG